MAKTFLKIGNWVPLLCAIGLTFGDIHGTSGTWTSAAGGAWDSGANWSSNPSFPNASDETRSLHSFANQLHYYHE